MFALARHMGYEMRPITRRFDAPRQTPSPRSSPSKDYRAPFRPRDYFRTKCFSCGHSGRQWHIVAKEKLTERPVAVVGSEGLAENAFSCHIMHLYTEVIWDGRGRWRGWQIVSIGRVWPDDVRDWLSQCVACIKRKSPVGRHHLLGNIPTGHRWDRLAMDILDVCDPTPEGFRYILVIADYFSKWTEAFPMKNKCADTVADILVGNIILRFGMPLVIHSDQGREFENGLMKSLCALLGCTKTRTAPYHPESDGMIERFNRTCLMMRSMFVNDRRDNWHELLPFVMHAYRTSVHESTGYSPFRLMMGEECSLPQDVSTAELRTQRENDAAPHPFATWVRDALEVAYDHVRSSLKKTASRRKRLYDTKAVNRKFPVGSWVLRYYPPAAQHKLGSPWVGPHQVVRQATGHTVGIQRDADKPIIFVHVDDLKLCPGPQEIAWSPRVSTAKSLCASTVAFRPGSDMGDVTPDPSVDVSAWGNASDLQQDSEIMNDLDMPIDLTGHILSPFYQRELMYQGCTFQSIAHLLCYRYAIINNQKTFATGIRKWSRVLVDFPIPKFKSTTENPAMVRDTDRHIHIFMRYR